MQYYEFFILFSDNICLYLISLLIVALPSIYIGGKYTRGWIDPLRYVLIFVTFANAVPLFLFWIDEIPAIFFYYFAFSETLFWFGFVLLAKKEITLSKIIIIDEKRISLILYYTIFFLYTAFTLFTYLKFGIPIFSESRLTTLEGSGGFGILARFNNYFIIYILMYSYYRFDQRVSILKNILPLISFLTIAITGVLSGSRGSFLIFIYAYFGYQYFFKEKVPSLKKITRYIPIIIGGAIIVLLLNQSGSKSLLTAFLDLGYRFIGTGDVYWMAYPNDVMSNVHLGNSFEYLFSGILGPLRLIDNTQISPPVGAQLNWYLNPSIYGVMIGPNARPPVLGYVLFGWFGLLFSFILGLFVSFSLFRLPGIFPKGFITSTFVLYIYLAVQNFIGDPPLGMTYLFDVSINFVFLVVLVFVLQTFKNKFDLLKR